MTDTTDCRREALAEVASVLRAYPDYRGVMELAGKLVDELATMLPTVDPVQRAADLKNRIFLLPEERP